MRKRFYLFINHYASKLSVWSWQKLWGNKKTGLGYEVKVSTEK
tara:strand:- start:43 stop:171 length:129 start_codon:yes stop_codon:yes gene_type:complete